METADVDSPVIIHTDLSPKTHTSSISLTSEDVMQKLVMTPTSTISLKGEDVMQKLVGGRASQIQVEDIMKYVTALDIKRNITIQANRRTLFAYYRTSLGYAALGLLAFKVFNFKELGVLMFIIHSSLAFIIVLCGKWASTSTHIRALTGIEGRHKDSIISPMAAITEEKKLAKGLIKFTGHELAVIRTKLANMRTLLAYLRTGIPALALSYGEFKLRMYSSMSVCLFLGTYFSFFGIYAYFKQGKIISKAPPSLDLSGIRTSLANMRTFLSYLRTVFGFTALSLVCFKFVHDFTGMVVGVVFMTFGVLMFFYALYSWRRSQNAITSDPELHKLALIRTRLANLRTYLADIRTFHPLAGFTFAAFVMFPGWQGMALASASLAFSLFIWGYGGWSWSKTNAHINADPSTHHLAIRRTELSNTRTYLACTRVGLSSMVIAFVSISSFSGAGEYAFISFFGFGGIFVCLYAMWFWNRKNKRILSWLKAGVV